MTVKSESGHTVETGLLHLEDAHALAPLLASYTQALKRGAPRRPDDFYAEQLLQDRTAQVMGAKINGALVGFMIFYDLPEPLSGLRTGQVDHIHVHHAHQGQGIATAMIDALRKRAQTHGWARLVFHVPRLACEDGKRLYGHMAVKADWTSFILCLG